MKKVIKQILASIQNEPEAWKATHHSISRWDGIEKDGVIVDMIGNTKLLSIVHVKVNDARFETNCVERYYLEKAVLNWYKHCDLNMLLINEQT